jgi:hypothetical protein
MKRPDRVVDRALRLGLDELRLERSVSSKLDHHNEKQPFISEINPLNFMAVCSLFTSKKCVPGFYDFFKVLQNDFSDFSSIV